MAVGPALMLALALALLPLPLHVAASHRAAPGQSGESSMAAPVPLMAEGGARVPAPVLGVLLLLPPAPTSLSGPRPLRRLRRWLRSAVPTSRHRLVDIGRLLLEGG